MLTVTDVADFVQREVATRKPPVGVYWYECTANNRQRIAQELSNLGDSACLIPLMLRRGFDNANSLASDVVGLLNEERATIEPLSVAAARVQRPICLVLLSRTKLAEPVIGSPIRMPEWFAYGAGTEISIDIRDV